ncbi:ATP-dependent nuclease [Rhizobium leguminosarum]|uniref:ATP-dependent nuclease n=1 Tax=Rhizobium leguminosarum TaxID=384 RepID=UPI0015BA9891|nr:AAA family ATPase [Rhizobium leguminosarum]
MKIKMDVDLRSISVTKTYNFTDSKFSKKTNFWNGIEFSLRRQNDKSFQPYRKVKGVGTDIWLYLVQEVGKDLFELVYFPTFIVDMPSRIYIKPHDRETAINLYYRKVIEDVLKSIGGGLDLQKHIIDRLSEAKKKLAGDNWFSVFGGMPERKLIDAVIQKIQQAINKEVIGSWAKLFKGSVASRSVKIEWNIDSSKDDLPYVSFGISDGHSTFSVHERSLGFRWFFSYLLFTQFRSKSGRKAIFLFDEPAANLHSKAQMQLMESIAKIVEGGNKVIYSTHSPHMINPHWLADAFIVENRAVDLEAQDDVYGFDTKPTDIKVTSYGTFVGLYPEKTTYFQPVWEKLFYEVPPIIGNGPFLCVEGISDFHFLSYARSQSQKESRISIVPGVGAGGFTATLPSLYGMGAKFALLLDDDQQGRKEKLRYVTDGILAPDQVYTLSDVDPGFTGKKLESLLSHEALKLIANRFDGKSGKKQIGMYLAEIAAANADSSLDADTMENAWRILDWAENL